MVVDHGQFGQLKTEVYPTTEPSYIQNSCGNSSLTAYVRHYAFYVITTFGCVSNFIVLAVLVYSRRMRSSVSGTFLFALTISDTCYLLGEEFDSLSRAPEHTHVMRLTDLECSFISFVKFSARFSATFIVLCISVNRLIVVVYPIKAQGFNRPKYAVIQIAVVLVLSLVASIYAFSVGATKECGCRPVLEPTVYAWGVTIVDVLICDIVASFLISVLSLRTVYVFRRSVRQMLQRQDSASSVSRKEGERHTTILLLSVASTFVLLRMPYTLSWTPLWFTAEGYIPSAAGDDNFVSKNSTMSDLHNAANITQIFSLVNHAINLYLYCLCSKGFREELWKMLHFKKSSWDSKQSSIRNRTASTSMRSRSLSRSFSSGATVTLNTNPSIPAAVNINGAQTTKF